MLGCSFSHYRIIGKLGEGGMGVVYRAQDTLLHREVAIKFPIPGGHGSEERERLFREARAASALVHPNIATVYDCGECDGSPYVVMELVPGKTLADELRAGPIDAARAGAIVGAVCDALAEAHRNGVVHRDIKPSNIALNERGQVKVLDFGIAGRIAPLARSAAAATELTATLYGGISGTPAYMAPEQARGLPSDPRGDLFSLGAVLYECLTGRRPFEGATAIETVAKVLEQTPPPPSTVNPAVPHALDAIVSKALAKDPQQRYGTAGEMLADLTIALHGRPRTGSLLHSWRVRTAAGVVVSLLLLMVLWLAWPAARFDPKPEAKRYFDEGLSALSDGTYHKAARMLEQAVRIDPEYTLAQAHLADAWNELDYSAKAQTAMLKALPPGQETARLSGRDLLHVQAIHQTLTHNYGAAAELYRRLIAKATAGEKISLELDLARTYEHADRLNDALGVYRSVLRRETQAPAAYLRAGVVYRRLRQMRDAESSLRTAESLYRSFSNLEGVTEALYQQSIVAHQSGHLGEARSLLDEAARIARVSGNDHQQVTVLLQLDGLCARQGLFDEARRHALEALETAQRTGFDDLVARSLLALGADAQFLGDAQDAKRRFSDALSVAQRIGARRTEARARFSLASVKLDLGETATALTDLAPAMAFYKAGGYATELSRCAMVQCRALRNEGRYDEARRLAEDQLNSGRTAPDPVLEHLALEALASIAAAKERYSEALALYMKTRDAARSKNDAVGEYWAVASIGDMLWRLGRYVDARRALEATEVFGVRTKTQALLAASAMSRAEMALSQFHTAEAVRAAEEARRLAPENREISAAAARIGVLARAHSGSPARAAPLADEAVESARATGNVAIVAAAQLAKTEALALAGQGAAAAELAQEVEHAADARGQYESAWRASLLAGAGPKFVAVNGKPAAANDAFAKVRSSLSPSDFTTYTSRPDVRLLLRK